MGMYDYVKIECNCPLCGRLMKGFQTKDGPCFLGTLVPGVSKVDPQLRFITTYTSCIHGIELDEDTDLGDKISCLNVLKRVWVNCEIPVNKDGTISKDKRRYKWTHEVAEGKDKNAGILDPTTKWTPELVKEFNEKVKALEEGKKVKVSSPEGVYLYRMGKRK